MSPRLTEVFGIFVLGASQVKIPAQCLGRRLFNTPVPDLVQDLETKPDPRIQTRFRRLVPQIAIGIGVLTSNTGGGRRTILADWTWHQGAEDVVPLLGVMVGCHCSVLWLGGG